MTTASTGQDLRAASLRGLCAGAVHLPGDPGYDEARRPWNVAIDQRPAAVAYPGSAEEVSAVVRAAAAAGLRVAPQGTGHNAGPLGPLDDVVLLRTSAMTAVEIDKERMVARVEAGALWLDAVEMVTGGGSLLRADKDTNPDVFWAVRGGGGSFGVVTALEFRLYPIESAYGGMLVWDVKDAEKVLRRWAEWSVDAPEEVTTSFRILNVPPMPDIPEAFRGRQLAVVDGAVLDTDERAEEILVPLRALEPEMDMFMRMPAAGLVRIHMDPEGPTPATSATAMLDSFPEEAVEAFLRAAGLGSGSSLLLAELRQLGGALSRPAPGAGAVPRLDSQFILFAAAIAATPEMEEKGYADATALVEALKPYATGRNYLNFAEKPVDVSGSYPAETWRRLAGVRSAVDPDGTFLADHPVPRLYENGQPAT